MFPGRDDEMKEVLFARLHDIIARRTSVPPKDILFVIIESERKNWASSRGIPLTKVDLGY